MNRHGIRCYSVWAGLQEPISNNSPTVGPTFRDHDSWYRYHFHQIGRGWDRWAL